MPFSATVYRVLIASPSDLQTERDAVAQEIQLWNSVMGPDLGVILMPVRWETDVTPRLGDRPQEIVNDEIVRPSDILVGVFWARIGSPTGVAESGTIEEIREFRASGKPVMLYFSTADVPQRNLDTEQYQRLLAFKAEMRTQGITQEFSDPRDLQRQISRHLTKTIQRLEQARKEQGIQTAQETAISREETMVARAGREAMIATIPANSSNDGWALREDTSDKACIALLNRGKIVTNGERITAEFTLQNEGDATARDVTVEVEDERGQKLAAGGKTDAIAAEQARVFRIPLTASPRDQAPVERRFTVRAKWRDRHGWDEAIFGLVLNWDGMGWKRTIDPESTVLSRPCRYVQPG